MKQAKLSLNRLTASAPVSPGQHSTVKLTASAAPHGCAWAVTRSNIRAHNLNDRKDDD